MANDSVKLPRYSWGQNGGPPLGSAKTDANDVLVETSKTDFISKATSQFSQSSDQNGGMNPRELTDKSLDKKVAYNMSLYYDGGKK